MCGSLVEYQLFFSIIFVVICWYAGWQANTWESAGHDMFRGR